MCSLSRVERDQRRPRVPAGDLELEHRVRRSAPTLGRAAWIQDPYALVPLDLRDVRVAVHDGLAIREPTDESCLPAGARARDVGHADANAVDLDYVPLRERFPQPWLVHVPVDGLDPAEPAQLVEDEGGDDVAEVEDHAGRLAAAQAFLRKAPRAPRQVRVCDDRDERQLSARNAPSR